MKKIYTTLHILSIILLLTACSKRSYTPYSCTKSLEVQHAMVVTAHPVASNVGLQILQQGGNAVDAAIAVQFALAVCYPVAGNIGGGGFMIYRQSDGALAALDFREKAPGAAYRDMYLDKEGNAVSEWSQNGELSAGVPGTVDGMWQAYQRYSQLKDWKKLVQPAIDLAEKGFYLTERQAGFLNYMKPTFDKYNQAPTALNIQKFAEGTLLIQSELAETLKRIRDHGRDGFYSGATADHIVDQMERSNGIITYDDLQSYKSKWRTPITTDYRGHRIISMPPPSSGGIALVQMLEMMELYDIGKMGLHTPSTIHLIAEIERRVYADRSEHLGDSDYYDVPVDMLLDPEYLAHRMANFDPERASQSHSIRAGQALESMETTHFSIVDTEGNAVSITTTINGAYGSKTVVQGAGFLLNNEMDDFSAKPGVPNMFGLVGTEANKIEPGKRMLSSMTPTIVTEGDELKIVVGTPGGSTIITSVLQVISNVIDHDMNATEAVGAPRFHHQWLPDEIRMEGDAFSEGVLTQLRDLGHRLNVGGSIGLVECIVVHKDGTIEGAADPRADDTARGY